MADNTYLAEAFKALKELDEDIFDLTADGATQADEFISDEETNEIEDIIDPLATSEEELQDSYIGKAILDCTICQSKIYKDPTEVILNEDESLANVGEECPYCQSSDGYKVIGQVAPYTKTEVDVEVTTKDGEEHAEVDLTTDEEKVEEACETKDCKEKEKEEELKEDLNGVTIDTDKETINITATEKAEEGEEMIVPVEPETEAEFQTEAEPAIDTIEDPAIEPEYQDIEIDEFDETDFDGLGEAYLKRIYENVKSYKTVKGSIAGNLLKLEGVITFKSGKEAKTNFVFESSTVTKSGKVKLLGENTQFAKNKAFTLSGKIDGKKFISESLTYHYTAKDGKSGASKRLYGTVRK